MDLADCTVRSGGLPIAIRISTDAVWKTSFTTGTYSTWLSYRILYKTNYSTAYQVLASNPITGSNYSFSMNAIPT